ncbi:uncharacterized protein LOC111631770 [Centruroides sculpturatus]|uniref:uncharacterized protein LOC111631770 n=1 Tax=Centruroides sculpturatus TaxID=218467 RepID=UPI000C6E7469|nr:uncharacterized protein LOC111631770 [Centruroides sculpturatus]
MKYLAVLAFVALFYVCNCEGECFNEETKKCIKDKLDELTAERKQEIKDKAVKCCNDNKDDERLGCIIKQMKDSNILDCINKETKKCLLKKIKNSETFKDIVNDYKNTDDCDGVVEQIMKKMDDKCSNDSGDDKDFTFACECKEMFFQQ